VYILAPSLSVQSEGSLDISLASTVHFEPEIGATVSGKLI